MLIVLDAAVEPEAFEIPSIREVAAPETIVNVLLFNVADAEVAVPINIPLSVDTWFTPEPLLLLMVLYDTFKLY